MEGPEGVYFIILFNITRIGGVAVYVYNLSLKCRCVCLNSQITKKTVLCVGRDDLLTPSKNRRIMYDQRVNGVNGA